MKCDDAWCFCFTFVYWTLLQLYVISCATTSICFLAAFFSVMFASLSAADSEADGDGKKKSNVYIDVSVDNLLLSLQKYGLRVGIMCSSLCPIIYEVLSGPGCILLFEIHFDYFNLD